MAPMEAGVSPRPTILRPAPTLPAGKARQPTVHGGSRLCPTATNPHTPNMFRTPRARSERSRAREAARLSGPRPIALTPSRGRPPVVTCTPAGTGTFSRIPATVGASTAATETGIQLRLQRPRPIASKIIAKAPTDRAEPIGPCLTSGTPVEPDPVPASATWTAILAAGSAAEPAANALVISSARAAAAAVSPARGEGADGGGKRGASSD
jgi:hypothetical protein